jgi:hypothetical protein
MPWGRLDDGANGNAKLLALSDAAWRMWGCGVIYCQANLTDGFIPRHAIETWGVRAKNKPAIARELCTALIPGKAPLWHEVEGGYRMHDYHDWNDAKEEIEAKREKNKARKERWIKRRQDSSGTRSGHVPEQASISTTISTEESSTDQNSLPVARDPDDPRRPHPLTEAPGVISEAAVLQFDRLWLIYPNQEGKVRANREWVRLNPAPDLGERIIAEVRSRVAAGWGDEPRFVPHLARFLSEQMWLEKFAPRPKVTPRPEAVGPVVPGADETARRLAEHRAARDAAGGRG